MITFIFTVILIFIAIYCFKFRKNHSDTKDLVGILSSFIALTLITIMTICISTKTRDFEHLKNERDVLTHNIQSLDKQHNNMNNSITVKISNINTKIINYQYDNTSTLFDWFIDDRIDTLQIISIK